MTFDPNYVPTWDKENATAPSHQLAAAEIAGVLDLTDAQYQLAARLIQSVLAKEEERTNYWREQYSYVRERTHPTTPSAIAEELQLSSDDLDRLHEVADAADDAFPIYITRHTATLIRKLAFKAPWQAGVLDA
jgi:hypothetical protein